MDRAKQKLEFLDTSECSDVEREHINQLLYSKKYDLKLPWGTDKNLDEGVVLEGAEECREVVDPAQTAGEEWVAQQYDEQGVSADGSMGQIPPPQRLPPYPPGYVYMPWVSSPYPPQAYAYQEVDRAIFHTRPGKKGEKKIEPQTPQYPVQPVQYVNFVPYPTMYPGPHYMPPMTYYTDYQPGYVGSEQPPYTEEASYAPELSLPPADSKQENHTTVPVTEFQPHEHMCFQEDVTVKAPKKKPVEEVVADVTPEPQVVDAVLPVPALVEQANLPMPAATPVAVPSSPSMGSVLNAPENASEREEVKPRVVEYANTVRNTPEAVLDVVINASQTPATELQKMLSPATAEPKAPAPLAEFPETPLIEPKGQHTRAEYPHLPPSSGPASSLVPVAGGPKSWAGLFETPKTEVKPRPLARVTPFEASARGATLPPSTMNTASAPLEQHHDYRLADDPYTVQLGERLREHQLDHRAVSFTPRGLTNRSNWCYVNAILQALIACPSFYNLLRALPVPQDPKQASRTPIIGAMVELVQCFPLLSTGVRPKRNKHSREEGGDLPKGSSFEPAGVYKVLDKVRGDSNFSIEGRQEDAEEFLSCLLNGLNDEMLEVLKLVGGVETEMPNGDVGPELDTSDGWKVMGPKNKGAVTRRAVCGKTPVSDIFRGQLRSRVQRAGDEYTDNVQPFFTLQLDIEKASSVREALELLVGKDPLEGMTCSRTHQEIEAWTQTTLEDLPLILILHLKCFDYKQDGCSKITKLVDYTVDLTVEPKLMSLNKNKYSGKQRNYKLVAVVYHDGKEATKGHYVTDAYHVGLACWIQYDDGNVRKVREEHVLRPASPRVPYLLCYRRADTMSPTNPK